MHYNFEISRGNSSIFEISRGKSSNINHFFFSLNVALVNVPPGKLIPSGQVYFLWPGLSPLARRVPSDQETGHLQGQTYRTGSQETELIRHSSWVWTSRWTIGGGGWRGAELVGVGGRMLRGVGVGRRNILVQNRAATQLFLVHKEWRGTSSEGSMALPQAS